MQPIRFRRVRRALAAIAAAGVVGATLTLVPTAASAQAIEAPATAPAQDSEFTTVATVESLRPQYATAMQGEKMQLLGAWTLPDDPAGPAGLVLPLPEGLYGLQHTFSMMETGSNTVVIAACAVTPDALRCEFDQDYLDTHSTRLYGTFAFSVRVVTEVETEAEVTYDFIDNQQVTVTVSPVWTEDRCPECVWEGQGFGTRGEYDNDTMRVDWRVFVPAPVGGMRGNQQVIITRPPAALQTPYLNDDGTPHIVLMGANSWLPGGQPTGWAPVDPESVQLTAAVDGAGQVTARFTTRANWVYIMHLYYDVTDNAEYGQYTHWVDINVLHEQQYAVSNNAVMIRGEANGSGVGVGAFDLNVDVDGDLPGIEDAGYHVMVIAHGPGPTVNFGLVTVGTDGTWRSPQFLSGSVARVLWASPFGADNIAWNAPEFSSAEWMIGTEPVAIDMTISGTPQTSAVGIAATVAGDADAVEHVATPPAFTVDYSYPAGVGFHAGEGTLTVTADGALTTTDAIPVTAEVTFVAKRPKAVQGIVWGAPIVTPSTFTVGPVETESDEDDEEHSRASLAFSAHAPAADPSADVTIVQTATLPDAAPQPTTAGAVAGLPSTGVELGGLLGAALLLLALGVLLACRRSRG